MRFVVRIAADEYLNLTLRAHELLRDVPLYDVSVVDLPGGGARRSIADVRALDSSAAPSIIATVLFAVRRAMGRLFGWDRSPSSDRTLLSRLSDSDRRE